MADLHRMFELPSGILAEGEAVSLAVRAAGPQSKWVAPLLSTPQRVVLVFTNERLLVIKHEKRAALASLSECRWRDVKRIRLGRISNRLTLRFSDGRSEVFTLTRGRDASLVRAALTSLPPGGEGEPDGRQPLCPCCFVRMARATYHCDSCGSVFRDPRNAFRFALWWPGGGYFFLRRYSAGIAVLAGELLLLVLIKLTWDLQAIRRIENAWPATAFIVFAWAVLKLATGIHARSAARELIIDRDPKKRSGQIPPLVLAATAREVAVVTGSAAVVAALAAKSAAEAVERAAEAVERAAGQIVASPGYQRVVTELASTGPAAFLPEELPDEERRAFEEDQRVLAGIAGPAFNPLLENGERVLLMTRGATPYTLLDYLGPRWLFYFLRRCVYVFTDRRMFMIRVSADDKPVATVSAVWYSDVKTCTFEGGFGLTVNMKLTLAYNDGRKETFNRIPLADLERIRALLPAALANVPAAQAPRVTRGRCHYCAWCGTRLFKGVYACRRCGATYANRRTAFVLSMFIPGGGYFYLGMPKLGIADAIVEWFLALNAAGFLVGAMVDPSTYGRAAAVTGTAFVIEKVVSIRHALDQASEFVSRRRPGRVWTPLLRVQAEPSYLLNSVLVAGGILLMAAGAAVRAPLYAPQKELAQLVVDLVRDDQRLKDWEQRQNTAAGELTSLEQRLITLERQARGTRRWFDRGAVLVRPAFDDASKVVEYERLRDEFESKAVAYESDRKEMNAIALSYNTRLERAHRLEERIGNVWYTMLTWEALGDAAAGRAPGEP